MRESPSAASAAAASSPVDEAGFQAGLAGRASPARGTPRRARSLSAMRSEPTSCQSGCTSGSCCSSRNVATECMARRIRSTGARLAAQARALRRGDLRHVVGPLDQQDVGLAGSGQAVGDAAADGAAADDRRYSAPAVRRRHALIAFRSACAGTTARSGPRCIPCTASRAPGGTRSNSRPAAGSRRSPSPARRSAARTAAAPSSCSPSLDGVLVHQPRTTRDLRAARPGGQQASGDGVVAARMVPEVGQRAHPQRADVGVAVVAHQRRTCRPSIVSLT